MVSNDKALGWVYSAFDAVNGELEDDEKIAKSPDTRLQGEGSAVDSLTIINLLIELESVVEQETGNRLSLMNTDAAAENAFATAQSLADYVVREVNKA
jgi:hypothetical protein